MIWKNHGLLQGWELFRAHPIYFLYLLAHLSFYFQQIHFQTFFHLPGLLLSCCFFCTQAGNLFWKRCFNISSSQQSFCLLAHLYLNMLAHHRAQLKNTWWDCFSPQNPQSQMQPGSCNMHNPLKPSSKKSISLYWGGGQGRKQHGKNVKVWNK